jgi:hypothetical protein
VQCTFYTYGHDWVEERAKSCHHMLHSHGHRWSVDDVTKWSCPLLEARFAMKLLLKVQTYKTTVESI